MSTSDIAYRIAIARGDLLDAVRELNAVAGRAAVSVYHLRTAFEESGLPALLDEHPDQP